MQSIQSFFIFYLDMLTKQLTYLINPSNVSLQIGAVSCINY